MSCHWPNKVFGTQKNFFGSPIIKKSDFLKNLNSVICLNIGGGQRSGPGHPDGVGPLGSIR